MDNGGKLCSCVYICTRFVNNVFKLLSCQSQNVNTNHARKEDHPSLPHNVATNLCWDIQGYTRIYRDIQTKAILKHFKINSRTYMYLIFAY